MDINLEEVDKCKFKITYKADYFQIQNKKHEVIQHFRKAPIKGFRRDKEAPLDLVKVQYKKQIDDATKKALVDDAYNNVLFEKQLKPFGPPAFTSIFFDGDNFECELELHTKPTFDISQYTNLEVPKPVERQNVNDLVEAKLQDLRYKYGTVSPYSESDFVQKGDTVIVDYESTLDGEKIEQLCASGEMLKVGSGETDIIDQNILGMTVGETRTFKFVVPDSGLPSCAGKEVEMSLTVNMGSKTELNPLDDSLALKISDDLVEKRKLEKAPFSTLDELRQNIVNEAQQIVFEEVKRDVLNAIASKLIEDNKGIDIPSWLYVSEAKFLVSNSGLKYEEMKDVDREKYFEIAKKNVILALCLDKIRELEPQAQLTDQECFDILRDRLKRTMPLSAIDAKIKEMNNSGFLQILFSRLKDEHTLDFVLKTTKVVD